MNNDKIKQGTKILCTKFTEKEAAVYMNRISYRRH